MRGSFDSFDHPTLNESVYHGPTKRPSRISIQKLSKPRKPLPPIRVHHSQVRTVRTLIPLNKNGLFQMCCGGVKRIENTEQIGRIHAEQIARINAEQIARINADLQRKYLPTILLGRN